MVPIPGTTTQRIPMNQISGRFIVRHIPYGGRTEVSSDPHVRLHELHHTLRQEWSDKANNSTDSHSVRFRQIGTLLAKGERIVGMVADGGYDIVEFLDEHGKPLMTDEERAGVSATLADEALTKLEDQLFG
jgi:hypothetical protein